jgi:pimeloyl-ACP methyl ester carboxylesterase
MLREGSGEPLVLLHGILNSERAWRRVIPLLSPEHDVVALTALGHNGGPRPTSRPVVLEDLIDATERQLDELGFEQVHLAGNSLGGWMALELARRGRAKSVCALSPAGFWDDSLEAERERVFKVLLRARKETPRARRIMPLLARSARFRRWALRDIAVHGDRVSQEEFLEMADDTIGCYIAEELIAPGHRLAPVEVGCPVTIAWSTEDRFFPSAVYRGPGESFVPSARVIVLEDTGHVPMMDDPKLVAETIRETVNRSSAGGSSVSLSSRGS